MTDEPRYADVDVAMVCGVIQLHGDGDQLIANLPGEKAEILRDMLTDLILTRDGGITEVPEFRAGFDFARKIGDASFRARLASIGWKSGSAIHPAVPTTTLGDLLRAMANHPSGNAWVAVVDPDAEHGFRMLTIAEPAVTALPSCSDVDVAMTSGLRDSHTTEETP